MSSFSFRGITKDYLFIKKGIKRPAFAPINRSILTTPGLPGGYLKSTDTNIRILQLPVWILANSDTDLKTIKEDLAEWLITKEPEEFIFPSELDRVYYAVVDGNLDLDELVETGEGTITFICPDPYKYGNQPKLGVSTDLSGPLNIVNAGTAETAPVFNVTLKQPTTYLDIIGDRDYMRIGQPVAIDTTPLPEKEIVFKDELSTTTGWANAQNSDIDGGVVVGTMVSNGYQFSATDYGTGDNWHGPAKIKGIGQALTDFEAEITLTLRNEDYRKHGRVELYLLDINKQAVCKLALKDISYGQDGNMAELRIGDNVTNHFIINERGDDWHTWMDFEGVLRLSRVGNKWTAYVAKFDANRNHTAQRLVEWTDIANQFTRKPAYVVVHIGAHGTVATNTMSTTEVKVSTINKLTTVQVPYIGAAGDVFTFDHKTSKILKNGELFMKKDFGSRFFKLQKGSNVLVFNPPEVIQEVRAEWRDAYL
jgi:predicted phage tail component-like protein